MVVGSVKEAWAAANNLFPCDYEYDTLRSARAGYPIYMATAFGLNAWISDLNDRLEVNLPNKSVNIWIRPAKHPLEQAGFKKNKWGIWV